MLRSLQIARRNLIQVRKIHTEQELGILLKKLKPPKLFKETNLAKYQHLKSKDPQLNRILHIIESSSETQNEVALSKNVKLLSKILHSADFQIEDISDMIQKLELDEISSLLQLLPQQKSRKVIEVIKILDQHSIEKCKTDQFHLEKSLALCHSWFETGSKLFVGKNWSQNFIKFPQELAKICLIENSTLNLLSPPDFVFLVYVASLYQDFPGAEKYTGHNYSLVPGKIQTKILNNLDKFDHVEMASLAESFYTCNIRFVDGKDGMTEIQKAFFEALLTLPKDLLKSRMIPFQSLCKILSNDMGNLQKIEHVNEIIRIYQNHIQDLSHLDKLKLLQLVGSKPPDYKDFAVS